TLLVDNQSVYQLYSEKFDESVMVPVNEVFVLDTTHFDEVYAVSGDIMVAYQSMLLSQEQQQIVVTNHIVELARVWNWQTQAFMIYGQLDNQYGWFDESVLTNDHMKPLSVQEKMLPDEQSGVKLAADVLPVDEIQPVSKIDQ